jgi:hypothetical protein
MGRRTQLQVLRELVLAGAPKRDAIALSYAAGLRGSAAERYVRMKRDSSPIISLQVQNRLFQEITTPEMVNDIKRICGTSSVVEQYGTVRWEELPRSVQELIFDLRYRGDYTVRSREHIQPALVNRDYVGLQSIMNDTSFWRELGVPSDRIQRRREIISRLEK